MRWPRGVWATRGDRLLDAAGEQAILAAEEFVADEGGEKIDGRELGGLGFDPATGQLLREHRRQSPGRHAIHPADQPARTPPTTLTLLARATRAGAHIGPLCAAIHGRDGARGVRRILGVLALAKQHGPAVVDAACAAALELGVADYRFVRRYLAKSSCAATNARRR